MWNFEKIPLQLRIQDTIENTFDGLCQRIDTPFTRSIFGFFKDAYHESIIKVLYSNQEEIFKKYSSEWTDGEYDKDSPIFVFWYQGLENAPPAIKAYYAALLRHSPPGHKIIFVDKNNVSALVNLPNYIYEKVENGIITLIHFSDLLRFTLLEKYGGLWLDATILVTKEIDENIFKLPFFTLRADASQRFFTKFLGLDRWCAFCCGGYKGSSLFSVMKELFLSYWKDNNIILDYFLMDIYLECLYRTNKNVKRLIDANSKKTREKIFFLADNFYRKFSKDLVNEYKELDIAFNTCSYKIESEKTNSNCLISKIIETNALCLEK